MAGPCPPRGAQRADPREEVGVSLGVLLGSWRRGGSSVLRIRMSFPGCERGACFVGGHWRVRSAHTCVL